MDVEIVKSNGQKFRLSDYGVVQDFVVNSIDRSVTRESVDGRKGSVDYGTNIGDRSISVPMIFKASDLHDYAHLRDELFGILDDDNPFYIREMRRKDYLQYEFVDFGQPPSWSSGVENEYVNGKQYKVRLDSNISPEQWDDKPNGDITIEFVTSGLPFAESIYTTIELHDSGYDATAEKYGMVDNIDDEKVNYRFYPEILTQNVGANTFKNGFLSSTTGQESDSSTNLIITSYVNVVIGNTYKFVDEGWSSAVQYWWIYEYDDNNKFIKSHSFSNKEFDFVPVGKKLKFMAQPYNDNTLKASDVGVSGSGKSIIPLLKRPSTVNTFSVYNAGNVTVEPESMYLDIVFADTRGDSITVKNKTTGEVLEINAKTTGHVVRQQGMVIYVGGINRFRDTNRRFIRLLPGINEFEVTGSSYSRASVYFKFYYK